MKRPTPSANKYPTKPKLEKRRGEQKGKSNVAQGKLAEHTSKVIWKTGGY
jgi:hypothetical protein